MYFILIYFRYKMSFELLNISSNTLYPRCVCLQVLTVVHSYTFFDLITRGQILLFFFFR